MYIYLLQRRDFHENRYLGCNAQPNGTKLHDWKSSGHRSHRNHATDVEKATQGHKEKVPINIPHRK